MGPRALLRPVGGGRPGAGRLSRRGLGGFRFRGPGGRCLFPGCGAVVRNGRSLRNRRDPGLRRRFLRGEDRDRGSALFRGLGQIFPRRRYLRHNLGRRLFYQDLFFDHDDFFLLILVRGLVRRLRRQILLLLDQGCLRFVFFLFVRHTLPLTIFFFFLDFKT
ncbi:MAG: hypothetical protein BWY88_01357 [Synergistetes bacterium ADurb.Bin520]|nr:MAG: hypothetical protein BWY88_01357 [Synergistetes bacterium ADurb.Bin520]